MRRVMLSAAMIVVLCFSSSSVFSEQIATRPRDGQGEWEMYNESNNFVGTLKRTEKGSFKFYNRSGKYIGLILESGVWIPKDASRSYTRISPEDARFYLDVLGAVKNIK